MMSLVVVKSGQKGGGCGLTWRGASEVPVRLWSPPGIRMVGPARVRCRDGRIRLGRRIPRWLQAGETT